MQGKNGNTFLQGHCLNDGALFFRLQFRKLIERTKCIRNCVFSLFSLLIADYIVKDTII